MLNIEFFLLLIAPWLTDLFGGKFIMLSIVGLGLWSLSLTFFLLRFSTKDRKLQSLMKSCSRGSLFLWTLYWLYAHFFSHNPFPNSFDFMRVLNLSHATFLVLSFTLIAVSALSSTGGLLKGWRLQSPRAPKFLSVLPSMESLMKTCHYTWNFAVKFWGLGVFLATLSLWLKYFHSNESLEASHWSYIIQQPKLLVTLILWAFLIVASPFFNKLRTQNTQNFLGAYLLGSILFISLFSILIRNSENLQHEAIRWILR